MNLTVKKAHSIQIQFNTNFLGNSSPWHTHLSLTLKILFELKSFGIHQQQEMFYLFIYFKTIRNTINYAIFLQFGYQSSSLLQLISLNNRVIFKVSLNLNLKPIRIEHNTCSII